MVSKAHLSPNRALVPLAALLASLACTKPKKAVIPPTAHAGVGQVALVGERVTLDATGSRRADGGGPDGLAFEWTIVSRPPGSDAHLSNEQVPNPWLDIDEVGDYIFRLVVSEGELSSRPVVTVVHGYEPLRIISQTPPNGAFETRPDAPVVVELSEPVQPETITPSSFHILDGTAVIPGFVEVVPGHPLVLFTPLSPYPQGRRLIVVVTQQVAGVSGLTLRASYRGHFHVSTEPDLRPPGVAWVDPANASSNVGLSAPLMVVFDESMDASTLTVDGDIDGCPDNIQVLDSALSCVPGSVTAIAGNTRALFAPQSAYSPGTLYSVIVKGGAGGVADVATNVMPGDFTSTFRVTSQADSQPPLVIASYPGARFRDVPLGAQVVVTLSEALDPASIGPESLTLEDASTRVVGTVLAHTGNRVITFTPDGLLTPGLEYTITLAGDGAAAVTDLGGLRLDGDGDGLQGGAFVSRFTTTESPTYNGELTLPVAVVPGTVIDVSLSDRDMDTTVARDTVFIDSRSSTGESERIELTETLGHSGVFEGDVATLFAAGVGDDDDGVFHVQAGDLLTFTYLDATSAAGVQRFEEESVAVLESLAAIIVSSISGNTSEAGTNATFTVNLASEPIDDVTVSFDSDDPSEGTVSTTSLTFTPQNFSTPQLVTVFGVDDDVDDDDQVYAIVFSQTVSNDAAYAAITPDAISLTNIDNDGVGISVSSPSGPTLEGGGTATFTVVLDSLPAADVSLSFDSNNLDEGTVSPTSLTFTTSNWSTAQTVTVTGVDDDIDDDNQDYAIVFAPSTSSDSTYDGLSLADVSMSNLDDDFAGFTIVPTSGLETTEEGGTAVFQIQLTSEPLADVTLSFDSNDTGEGTVSVTSLTFTATDWNTPQLVTLTGVNDAVQEVDQDYAVVFSNIASTDTTYSNLALPSDVTVTNLEVGVNGAPEILHDELVLGSRMLVRVMGDIDEYANINSGPDNDTLSVTLTSAADSETLVLAESATSEGDFDCSIEGCFIATAESGSATADNGVLEAVADEVITLTYADAMDSAGWDTSEFTDTATARTTGACDEVIVINEIVTDPQQDWNDTAGGDSTPFNATPGSGTVDDTDEWIELYNAGSCAVDLSGYELHMLDATPYTYEFGLTLDGQVLVFAGASMVTDFQVGDYLVIGRPAGSDSLDDDLWVRLDRPDSHGVVDDVALGTSCGGDGDDTNNTLSGISADAIGRSPNGADTGVDSADFASLTASIGAANP